jgi:hypothetical protein
MRRWSLALVGVMMLVLGSVHAAADEDEEVDAAIERSIGRPVRVQTLGGGSFQGVLLSVTRDRLEVLESDGEIVTLSRGQVRALQEIPGGEGMRAFYQDSASNRLIFAPTGFAMEPAELHVTDTELIVVTASYGLNDYLSFWVGISPLGAVASARGILPLGDSVALSAGTFVGLEWLLGLTGQPVTWLLMPYALASWGEPENNLTIGCAWALAADRLNGLQSYGGVAVVGGKLVLTATTALVSENWLIWGERFPGDGWDPIPLAGLFAVAFRIAGDRLSWDIGAIAPLGFDGGVTGLFGGEFVPLPWLSVTYRIR